MNQAIEKPVHRHFAIQLKVDGIDVPLVIGLTHDNVKFRATHFEVNSPNEDYRKDPSMEISGSASDLYQILDALKDVCLGGMMQLATVNEMQNPQSKIVLPNRELILPE